MPEPIRTRIYGAHLTPSGLAVGDSRGIPAFETPSYAASGFRRSASIL